MTVNAVPGQSVGAAGIVGPEIVIRVTAVAGQSVGAAGGTASGSVPDVAQYSGVLATRPPAAFVLASPDYNGAVDTVTVVAGFGAGFARPATVNYPHSYVDAVAGFGAGFPSVAAAGVVTNSVAWIPGFGAGFARPAGVAIVVHPIDPTTDGNGYGARVRTARAVAHVTPPVTPPPPPSPPSPGAPITVPIVLAPFGIPRVSETFAEPYVINGIPYNDSARTPWAPTSVVREVWAKQLQIVVSGLDVTFFRNVPAVVNSWSSQDPGGDAAATVTFPSVTSFDGVPAPPVLASGLVVGIAGTYTGDGYWQASATGLVSAYGDAAFFGDNLGLLNQPVTGIASHPTKYGYWLVAADGGVFTFGNSEFHGALPPEVPNAPIVGVAATATGGGYWLLGADGGIFTFGDAVFYGSAVGEIGYPAHTAVGIARSPDGAGYIIAASNGGVFTYGDAEFHGSGVSSYVAPYTAIATAPGVNGYLLVNTVGGAYAYGSVAYDGGANAHPLNQPVNSVALTPGDTGYWMSAGDGGVFAFGAAHFYGSQPSGGVPVSGSLSWLRLGAPITINAVTPADTIVTLFEGVIADYEDANAPGLQVQCVGCLFQLDWYLAKPIVNLPFVGYDPNTGTPIFGWDVGTAVAQAINSVANPTPGTAIGTGPQPAEVGSPFTGGMCAPVATGILTVSRGSWDKLLSSYITSILAQASSAGGAVWTVGLARPRQPVIELVDSTTINWTVWTGGHGIDTGGLALDQTTPANVIYGQGTSPTTFSVRGTTTTGGATIVGSAGEWANSKYPQLPPAPPGFPLTPPDAYRPGDGQTGMQPFTDWMRQCGYPLSSQDTYLVTNVAANVLDQVMIEQFQQMAGLQITGTVNTETWGTAFSPGSTAGAVSSVYYQPLWELAYVEPYRYNPSGDLIGVSPFFNKQVPRVERYEQMGQSVTKSQGMLSALLEGGRIQAPVWQGTLTLTADPEEGSRFEILAGQNILLRAFHGRDVLFHISAVNVDFDNMTVGLTVSATATALMTLAAIIARDSQAHGVQRAGRPSLVTLNVSSSVVTFDSESGAGNVPSTALTANGWTVIRVPFSEVGTIAETTLATSPATPFAVGVFSGPVTPASVAAAFDYQSPLVGTIASGANPWNYYQPALAALGLLYGAGGPSGACGYYPSDPSGVQVLSGEYVDGATWTYAPAPGFVPWLWVAFWAGSTCDVSGRFLVAPATS